MAGYSWRLFAKWNISRLRGFKNLFMGPEKRRPQESRSKAGKPKKLPFYTRVPPTRIERYQTYMNRAFRLSPTLEFEPNDSRVDSLLAQVADSDSLSRLDFELMIIQYVFAEPYRREKHRSDWVQTVMDHGQSDFFPDPWAIVAALFVVDESSPR
jgi:hypothetical protein